MSNSLLTNNTSLLLESLLQNVQSSSKNLSASISALNSLTGTTQSYNEILKSMQEKFAAKTETAKDEVDDEVSALFEKYDEELKKFQQEMAIFDMFHDAYISNGFYGSSSKSRNSSYNNYNNAWGDIFSLQAERLGAQTKIAIQTALRQQVQKLK